jgi:glycerol-3-phosphate cytidylyltransferase
MSSDKRNAISNEYYSKSDDTSESDSFGVETRVKIEEIKHSSDSDNLRIGFTCSTFDMFHPGHVIMLKDSKDQCDLLVVGIQTDPTLDRPDSKNVPIQNLDERKIMISSCRHVDYVVEYSTENDLYNILTLLKPDVRILGSDWEGKKYTGHDIEGINIHWHDRSIHTYSTTNLRYRVYMAELSN